MAVKSNADVPIVDPKPPVVDTSPGDLRDFVIRNAWREVYEFEATLARQEFGPECDINVLMARYERTGVMPPVGGAEPRYYDFTAMPNDLLGFVSMMDSAEEAFMALPALVRKEFDNDAVSFVEYASNPTNIEKMREWGLAKPVEPVVAPVVGPVPAPDKSAQ